MIGRVPSGAFRLTAGFVPGNSDVAQQVVVQHGELASRTSQAPKVKKVPKEGFRRNVSSGKTAKADQVHGSAFHLNS